MPDQDLAAALEQLRRSAGLSLRDLGRACGVPRSTLSDALAGRRVPRLSTVLAVVRACGADPEPWRHRWAATTVSSAGAGGATTSADAASAAEPASPAPSPAPEAARYVQVLALIGEAADIAEQTLAAVRASDTTIVAGEALSMLEAFAAAREALRLHREAPPQTAAQDPVGSAPST